MVDETSKILIYEIIFLVSTGLGEFSKVFFCVPYLCLVFLGFISRFSVFLCFVSRFSVFLCVGSGKYSLRGKTLIYHQKKK